jgi:hypothetical protein
MALATLVAQPASAVEPFGPVAIAVTAKACEPNEMTVPAGPVTFVITNKSSRLLEWEILKGVLVVDERENIAPGFKAKLTTKLDPGSYDVTCGVIGNPKGRLTVTAATGPAARPTEADLIAPAADFRVATVGRINELDTAIKALAVVAQSGDAAGLGKAVAEVKRAHLALAIVDGLLGAAAKPIDTDIVAIDTASASSKPVSVDLEHLSADFVAYRTAGRALVPTPQGVIRETIVAADRVERLSASSSADVPLADIAALVDAMEMTIVRFAPHATSADASQSAVADDLAQSIGRMRRAIAAADRQAVVAAAHDLSVQTRRLSSGLGF